jgi:hypothetical protein
MAIRKKTISAAPVQREVGPRTAPQPFSMHRFVSLWHCDCEYEVDGNAIYLWEPLYHPADLGEDARPSWEFEHVVFYRPVEKDWVRVNRHLMFDRGATPDVVLLRSGICAEVGGAQVVWRGDRWFIRWHAWKNSHFAKLAAAGIEAYKAS